MRVYTKKRTDKEATWGARGATGDRRGCRLRLRTKASVATPASVTPAAAAATAAAAGERRETCPLVARSGKLAGEKDSLTV